MLEVPLLLFQKPSDFPIIIHAQLGPLFRKPSQLLLLQKLICFYKSQFAFTKATFNTYLVLHFPNHTSYMNLSMVFEEITPQNLYPIYFPYPIYPITTKKWIKVESDLLYNYHRISMISWINDLEKKDQLSQNINECQRNCVTAC